MEEETGITILFILYGHLALLNPDPFAPRTRIRLSQPARSLFPTLLSPPRKCRLSRILLGLDLHVPKIASNALKLVSAAELCMQPRRLILAVASKSVLQLHTDDLRCDYVEHWLH